MKKFLSCFLSLILLTNVTFIPCTFAVNDSSVKVEKTESSTENSEKNNKISDEELKKKIINLMETGEVNVPHKTTLDVLYRILGIPVFLLKAALITAGSLISIAAITALAFYTISLNGLTTISDNWKDIANSPKKENYFNLNLKVSDDTMCVAGTFIIPIAEALGISLDKTYFNNFCIKKLQ